MGPDRLQLQRFELKYIIREETALAVRNFVSSYLEIDEYGATQENLSYPVHSLYLDSDDLKLYRSTINGDKNRFKLRLRYYADRPEAPVFFEIKKRTNNTISKQRGGVKREAVWPLLQGQLPGVQHMVSQEPKQFVAIQNFCRLMTNLRAAPKAHVFYHREAWMSPMNNSVRVTLDRDVQCDAEPTARLEARMTRPVYVFHEGQPNDQGFNEHGKRVVLELKFTTRFPDWFKDLVRVFNLKQCGAAKYVDGVALLGEHAVTRAFAFDGPPPSARMPASNSEVTPASRSRASEFEVARK